MQGLIVETWVATGRKMNGESVALTIASGGFPGCDEELRQEGVVCHQRAHQSL